MRGGEADLACRSEPLSSPRGMEYGTTTVFRTRLLVIGARGADLSQRGKPTARLSRGGPAGRPPGPSPTAGDRDPADNAAGSGTNRDPPFFMTTGWPGCPARPASNTRCGDGGYVGHHRRARLLGHQGCSSSRCRPTSGAAWDNGEQSNDRRFGSNEQSAPATSRSGRRNGATHGKTPNR